MRKTGASKTSSLTVSRLYGAEFLQGSGIADVATERAVSRKLRFGVWIRRTPDRVGFFPSFVEFAAVYFDMSEEERAGWCEFFLPNAPVRLFFDVEWIARDDTEDPQGVLDSVHRAVQAVLERCVVGNPPPDVSYTLQHHGRWLLDTGGRQIWYKYSFHMKYTHLIFSDYDSMCKFARTVNDTGENLERALVDSPMQSKSVIDVSMYARRVLRMPMARKWKDASGSICVPEDIDINPSIYFAAAVPTGAPTIDVTPLTDHNTRRLKQTRIEFLPAFETDYPPIDVTPDENRMIVARMRAANILVPETIQLNWQATDAGLPKVEIRLANHECLLCKRLHERAPFYLIFFRSDNVVCYNCYRYAAEHPSRSHHSFVLPLSDVERILDADEPVPWDEVYELDRVKGYVFPGAKSTLCVQAQYGLGKTKALEALFQRMEKGNSVIFVTNRIRLARKYAAQFEQFGVQNYERVKYGDAKPGLGFRVATCYNSLLKFTGETIKYDYVILDEISSVLPDTMNRYVAGNGVLLNAFGDLVYKAHRVVAMDAHVTWMAYDFLVTVRGRPTVHMICNTYQRPCDRVVYECKYDFTQMVFEHLRDGKRVVVASMSKSYTNRLYDALVKEFGGDADIGIAKVNADHEGGKAHHAPGFVVDNTTTWKTLRCLIYSPSIGAGVSFEELHFDVMFIYGYVCKQTPTAADVLQMMHRVRQLIDDKVYVYWAKDKLYLEEAFDFPSNIGKMVELFKRNDAATLVSMMPTPPPVLLELHPISRMPNMRRLFSLDYWGLRLYCGVLLRRLRSLLHFKELFFEMLEHNGYRRGTIDNVVELEDEDGGLAQRLLSQQQRERRQAELIAEYPEIEPSIVKHVVDVPADAFRSFRRTCEWLADPVAFSNAVREDATAQANATDHLPHVHDIIDRPDVRRDWVQRMVREAILVNPSDHEVFCSNASEYAALRNRVQTWWEANPMPKSGRKRALGSTDKVDQKKVAQFLMTGIKDHGFFVETTGSSQRADRTYRLTMRPIVYLRDLAAQAPDRIHSFIYDLCREQVDHRRKRGLPANIDYTKAELGEWYASGAKKRSER